MIAPAAHSGSPGTDLEVEQEKHFFDLAQKRLDATDRADAALNTKINYALVACLALYQATWTTGEKLVPSTERLVAKFSIVSLGGAMLLLLMAYVPRKMGSGVDVEDIRTKVPMTEKNYWRWSLSNTLNAARQSEKILGQRGWLLFAALLVMLCQLGILIFTQREVRSTTGTEAPRATAAPLRSTMANSTNNTSKPPSGNQGSGTQNSGSGTPVRSPLPPPTSTTYVRKSGDAE